MRFRAIKNKTQLIVAKANNRFQYGPKRCEKVTIPSLFQVITPLSYSFVLCKFLVIVELVDAGSLRKFNL